MDFASCRDTRPIRPIGVTVGGVVPADQVVGRTTELELVHDAIVSANGAVLTGDRRFGKTSLLNLLQMTLTAAGHTVIAVNAQTTSAVEFAQRLEAALRPMPWYQREAQHWSLNVEVGKWGVVLKRSGDETTTTSIDLFEWAAQRVGPGRLIIIIDELTVLLGSIGESPEDAQEFLNRLRRVRQSNANLSMVFAGSVGLHHVVPPGLGLVNDLHPVAIGALDPCDALFLARCLIAGEELDTPDERALAEQIVLAADAIPYYEHFIVQRLGRLRHIDDRTAQQVILDAIADPLDPLDFRHYRDRLPHYYGDEATLAERCLDHYAMNDSLSIDELLAALGADTLDPRPTRGGLIRLVERLENDHYLRKVDGGRDQFASRVLRLGWRAIQRLGN